MSDPRAEFLVTMELLLKEVPANLVDTLAKEERAVVERFFAVGSVLRLWRVPGRTASISVWRVKDATELDEHLSDLPLRPWMQIDVQALASHPGEPGSARDAVPGGKP